MGDTTTDQNLVQISGPKSVISQVAKAQAEVDISGFTNNIIGADSTIRFYDNDGKEIVTTNIEKSISKVRINVEILELKALPVVCEVTGTPEDGYQYTGEVEFSKGSVMVAAKSQILEHVEAINIPEGVLDVTDASEDVTVLVDLNEYLPDGIEIAENNFVGRINVTAKIEAERERAVRIPVERIVFEGLPERYQAVITEPANECSITLTGLQSALNEVTAEDVTASVDLEAWMAQEEMEELTEGSYWVPVNATVADSRLKQSGVTEVRVHIIERE